MKRLNTNQWIAVAAGLGFVAFMLYGNFFMNLFRPQQANSDNNTTVQLPQSGVTTQDITEGQGEIAEKGDTVTVHYVGVLPDGKVFDSSLDRNAPFSFTLGGGDVIRGWEEGLMGMREGGQRQLFIAPDYGYGAQGVGPIPPNSHLIFQVQLLDVKKPGAAQ